MFCSTERKISGSPALAPWAHINTDYNYLLNNPPHTYLGRPYALLNPAHPTTVSVYYVVELFRLFTVERAVTASSQQMVMITVGSIFH